MNKIDLFKPYFDNREYAAIKEVLKSGWIGLGPKVDEFENLFAKYIGIKYAVALNSCTSALQLALKLLDIKKGDEVIVPAITFVSTAHAVIFNNAKPVFADVNYKTMTIDFDDVKKKMTKRTRAIIPVHYSGYPIDIKELRKIVGNKIKIIEDCAHACGSELNGKKCGSFGNIGVFSFQVVKNLATGDGGMLITNNKKIFERAKRLRWMGINKTTWQRNFKGIKKYLYDYAVDEIGYKMHMNDLTAVIGIEQLKKLDWMNDKRKKIAEYYTKKLKNISWIELPLQNTDNRVSSWHIYCIKCKNKLRDKLLEYMQKNNIVVGVHYKPIYLYKCYNQKISLPNSEKLYREILSLPIHPQLTYEEIDKVINKIFEFGKLHKI